MPTEVHNRLDLRSLRLGALAAERDADLSAYFVESEAFSRIRTGTKFVVLGPRGSGKSALFRRLAQIRREEGALVIDLAPETYSYELMQQSLTTESGGAWAKQGAYAAAWKHLIYVRAMKEVASAKGLQFGAASRIYNYIRDNHAGVDKNPIGALISYVKRIEGIKLGAREAGLKVRDLQHLYKLEELEPRLRDLEEVAKRRPIVILVDELDRGWDGSEDAISFVAGLFQAAVGINQQTPHVRVFISLRKELYDNIPALYEDAQKLRDVMEVIEWDEPQLKNLIARRIIHSMPQFRGSSDDECWANLFMQTLDFRSAQSFNYIVDRTLYRPREILQFCSDAVNLANAQNLLGPLGYKTVSEAEHKYSEDRLKDIAAEYRFQYPELLSVFETFRGFTYTFSRIELETHCLSLICGELRIAETARRWVERLEPEHMIEALWRIGFLRALAVGGLRARRRSGSSYLGAHQVTNLNLATTPTFQVHAMFRSYLGMKEPKKRTKNAEFEPGTTVDGLTEFEPDVKTHKSDTERDGEV